MKKAFWIICSVAALLVLLFFVFGAPIKKQGAVQFAVVAPAIVDLAPAGILMTASVPFYRVELAPEALAIWRRYAKQRPTLLLLSDQPMITPLPASSRDEILDFVKIAIQDDLVRRSLPGVPDLMILPEMTVDAALNSGWLSRVVWALPLRNAEQLLTIEKFRQQLLKQGLVDTQEAKNLIGDDHLVTGVLRGEPFIVGPLKYLPALNGPVIVHIDQSYFQLMYKNDVSTPLLEIVAQTLSALRERKLSVLAVTFSYGNLDERIALDARFVGEILSHLVETPSAMDEPTPLNWKRQGDILYLSNLFRKEMVREKALALEKDLPNSPWVKFNLYRSAAEFKEGALAIDYLSQAVVLDRVYAVEYLELADMAYDKGFPDEALRMLILASEAFPENALIKFKIVALLRELGRNDAALELLAQLRQLPWSPVYYPDMINDIILELGDN